MINRLLNSILSTMGANRLGGETTSGAKRLVGAKRLGGNDQGGKDQEAKQLGEEIVWGRNDLDSLHQ